jgi:hypothetical protein
VAHKGTLRLRISGALVAGLTAAVLAVPAANAGPGPISGLTGIGLCPSATPVHPFSSWMDFASYELAPNGGFENGSSSWSLAGGAQVVSGNESFQANSSSDSHALALPAGGSATSGPVCVGGLTRSTVRFFASSGGSSASTVSVQIRLRGLTGGLLGILDGGSVTVAPGWQPTPVLLALQLPIFTSSVQIALTSSRGAVLVDDVYVDPWLTN